MVLDLSQLDFFGCAGYRTLKTLQGRCIMAEVDLTLITGPQVQRVLQVCEQAVLRSL
jgi:anti-anti-sigma regulatory factor